MAATPKFRRVLLQLSGEALLGDRDYGLSSEMVDQVAADITAVHGDGTEVCVVVGGGNIFRGISGVAAGLERTSADYMGMLATVMNALALQNAIEQKGVATRPRRYSRDGTGRHGPAARGGAGP